MAYTLETDNRGNSLSIEEYLDRIQRLVDVDDVDAVLESAPDLAALSANPRIMVDYLNQELADTEDINLFQKFNQYGATNFILGRGPGFAVRANLWLPPEGTAQQRESTHKLGVYQVPHDHDFSFLTVGFWGPGYSTSIYEYDPTSCSGIVGSKVDMQFLETTILTPGKVMYYRASQDIHTQEYPAGPSISINLLIIPKRPSTQYLFDVNRGTVSGVLANRAENGVGLCTLACHLGDDSTVERLDCIAVASHDPRVRSAAYDSLVSMVPDQASDLMRRALADPHPLVRQLGSAVMDGASADAEGSAPRLSPSTYTPYNPQTHPMKEIR